jgi:hypothetical protein
LGLLALLLVTVLIASGALFVKYKLEGLRTLVQQRVESRTGARIHVGAVVVNGLRGLRVDDIDVELPSENGPSAFFSAPVAYVYVNVSDLLYGTVSVDRVEADGAVIRLSRAQDQPWFAPDALAAKDATKLLSLPAFRVLGKNGKFEVDNIVGTSQLAVSDFVFDVARLGGSPDIFAKFSGKLNAQQDKEVKVDLRYTGMEDFDLRVQCASLTSDDVAVFFPGSRRFLQSGRLSPSLRLAGFPNTTLMLDFKTPFRDVTFRGQPDFIRPAEGVLSGVASYDSGKHVLTLTTAQAESEQLAGRLEGSIAFTGNEPELDLRLDATRLPVTEALSYVFKGRAEQYGAYDFKLEEPYQVYVTLTGSPESPLISFHGSAAAGAFSLAAKNGMVPEGKLQMGAINMAWSTQSPTPSGSISIVDGTLKDATTGLTARNVSGMLSIDGKKISIDPLNVKITENPFVGKLKYDLESGKLEASANGTLADIEKTPLNKTFKDVSLGGSVNIRCNLTRDAHGFIVDANADATQAELKYKELLSKQPGVGATAEKLHLEILPKQGVSIESEGVLATSPFSASVKLARSKGKWSLQSVEVSSKRVDIDAFGKLVKVPYHVSGGTISNGKLDWKRESEDGEQWRSKFTADVDRFAIASEGANGTLSGEGAAVEVEIAGENPATGTLKLKAKKAQVPPLREKWFSSFKQDEMFSTSKRPWTIDMAVDALELPPWKGGNFKGVAYTDGEASGLKSFSAEIDGGGAVQGVYRNIKQDNTYDMSFDWNGVPARYLLEQLNYPKILSGTTTGHVNYSMDRDDPGTLKGAGGFEIHDGQFGADFLFSQIQGRLENKISALPPSLRFSLLKSGLSFDRDTVVTPDLQLVSEGIQVSGQGSFVTHGDMDYDLKVSVSPAIAEQIPALRDNFNIQGLRLAQQNIELAFKVQGPMFNPKGELAELPPIGVTLVSSALEVTSDAMRVIDIPRKILTDLVKIGGGIVGMPK